MRAEIGREIVVVIAIDIPDSDDEEIEEENPMQEMFLLSELSKKVIVYNLVVAKRMIKKNRSNISILFLNQEITILVIPEKMKFWIKNP